MPYTITLPEPEPKAKAPEKFKPSDPSAGGGSLQFGPIDTGIATPEWLDRTLAGAGKAFNDLALGTRQRVAEVADKVAPRDRNLSSLVTGADPSRAAAVEREIAEARTRDAPLMDTTAGTVGNIGGNVAIGAAIPGGGTTAGARALLAAAGGAAQGALVPTTADESVVGNMLIGGGANAVGSGIASGVGKVFKPAKAGSVDAGAAEKFLADSTQVRNAAGNVVGTTGKAPSLSLGQLTGNDMAKRVEFFLAKLPGGKGWFDKLNEGQQAAVQKAIGRLTMDRGAGKAIGKLGEGKEFVPDAEFISALRSLPDEFKTLAGGMKPKGALAAAEEYAGTPPLPPAARKPFVKAGVDETKDDIVTAIRKLGGIDPADEGVGSLAKANPFGPDPRLGPVWRQAAYEGQGVTGTSAGHSLDRMTQMLHERGYVSDRAALDEVMDKLADSHMGLGSHYSTGFDHGLAREGEDPLVGTLRELTDQLRVRNEPAGPRVVKGTLQEGEAVPMGDYQTIRSQLGRLTRGAAEGSPDAVGYKSLRRIFDETADRSIVAQGADPAALKGARNAYQVQKLLQGAEEHGADGAVTYNPQKVARIVEKAIREGDIKNLPAEVQQELRQLMAFGKVSKLPSSSGTAENQLARSIATGAFLTGAGGLEAKYGDDLGHLPLLALAPWAGTRVMQGALRKGVNLPRTGSTLARIMSAAPAPAALSFAESER